MTYTDTTQFGLTMRFDVEVSGTDLGAWSSCDGLQVDFGLKEIRSGGNNEFKVWLPDRLFYPKLVLKRAMNARDSGRVMSWLRSMIDATEGGTATVTLRDSHNETVSSWTFANARPSLWKGPSLTATGKDVAIETLELVHEGFL
jgi:phage tail-like protein